MKAIPSTVSAPSQPEQVKNYIEKSTHPLLEEIKLLRQIILNTDASIGEEIKWNAPSFFYTGEMKPFSPREYKRHFIVFNLYKQDAIRLVFPSGAKVNDPSGLLEGDYTDGRRLALFYNADDIKSKQKALQDVIHKWLQLADQ
jgi:hypothetical protein